MKEKIAVAVSGGVDSSVSAYLLKNLGYEVLALTMKLPKMTENGLKTFVPNDVEKVCEKLEIPLHILDFEKDFKDIVINYFCEEYKHARTPNPCIICNQFIKFGLLLKEAEKLGAEFLATGHYANILYNTKKQKYYIQKAKNLTKDQSYFLAFLDQNQLAKIKFPLGNFETKAEIRKIAKNIGLPVHEKTDSQEICFIPNNDYRSFLANFNIEQKYGDIILTNGEKIGEHSGLINYTIGQRKGLGHNRKIYVKYLDFENNRVICSTNEELYSQECIAKIVNLVEPNDFKKPKKIKAKIRYKHQEESAKAEIIENNKIKVIFDKPQRAVTPGQILVLYNKDLVVGAGIIE